jgi:2-dehydro-3-deoxyphosphogluconate aldolase/(4S)-4-hydroxy-2-oxoglutarate aldolase
MVTTLLPATFLELLRTERLLPIIRAADPDRVPDVAGTLVGLGFRLFEVSLTTPEAPQLISHLGAAFPEAHVGAGTVLEPEQVETVAHAGARFVVSPAVTDAVTTAGALGLPSLIGALTPSEVVAAVRGGATAVKLFPAELGGPAYLSALRAPLPHVPLVPVGGVTVETGADYLRRGAIALGLGSPLLGDAAEGGSLAALAERAAAFRTLLTEPVHP